ncbi:MAG TPA: LPS export ABC transporter permease LptG [Alphaproteobacteria bacterium]|nr:LPS export ABC transporter permease LptG [Alphaproteobacteria bacterium]
MKNFFPMTLSWYLIRHYLLNFAIILLGILGIVYLFDTVELLRRAAKVEGMSLGLVLQMSMFKLPLVGQIVFPFAVLFSAILTFWQLSRRHELVIVRSSGLSVWQFITPIVLTALVIGAVNITLINPLSALLLAKYETLENEYLEQKSSLVSLSDQGLWLRQEHEGGTAILHSGHIKMPEWVLDNVMVFFFSANNDFLRRIDATSANLGTGEWTFNDAVVNKPKQPPEQADLMTMATDLTVDELENSFSTPETISIWKLPAFIKILEETGFDSTGLKIHFQNLLAQPLLFMAMILLAASVSLRPPRLRGTSVLVMSGVLIGFIVFFASSFLQALGASQQIPIIVAAWFPALISFLLGIGALMILEDG